MSAPNCGKCGRPHWNFQSCGEIEKKEVERKAGYRPPHVVRQPREDGLVDWADRLGTVDRFGEIRLMSKERRPAHIGRVTYPDGSEGPKAA